MILNIDNQPVNQIALKDDSNLELTFGELAIFLNSDKIKFEQRNLVFLLADNSINAYINLLYFIEKNQVVLLLNQDLDSELLDTLIDKYNPNLIWCQKSSKNHNKFDNKKKIDFDTYKRHDEIISMHDDLTLLLPTSGSTGSPKLVRHSLSNIFSSAKSVAQVFNIDKHSRAIGFLPIYYTMGLSVVNSHIYGGGSVVLTNFSLTDRRFWNYFKEDSITNFTGVPYSFEILNKIRFYNSNYENLKILSQGGGKLSSELYQKNLKYCKEKNIELISTYGQTEATARMGYLENEFAELKEGSIGKAIPGARFELIDDNGEIIEGAGQGELVFYGPTVTMGYANQICDLNLSDENNGFLKTGDIALRDLEGFYYIVGRKSRFLKILSLRIGLDDLETLIKSKFNVECVCFGDDSKLEVNVLNYQNTQDVVDYISTKLGLFHEFILVQNVNEFKRNSYGKIIYR